MQVKVERTEPCKARVSFNVAPEEFAAEVRELLKDIGARARMKGFRPGHVPSDVIERLHGKEVRREARQKFLQKAYQQAVGDNKLRPLSHPRVEIGEGDVLAGQEYGLEFDVTLRPDIELAAYKGLEVETALVPVSDEEVEAAIEQVRKNQAHPEPAGAAGLPADGMALCKVELIHEGEVVFSREGLRLGPSTAVPGVDPAAFAQALTGAVDGAVVDVPLTFPADFEVEAARGQGGTCRVTLNQTFKIVQPTREELLKLLELADEEALLARVREKLEEANQAQENQRIETALLERVIADNEFALPSGMLEEQTQQRVEQLKSDLSQQGLAGEALEKELASQSPALAKDAERSTKAFFLVESIAEQEKIQVAEADLREELKAIAQRNRSSLEEVANYYRDQQLFGQLAMEIMERKVRQFLRESATLKSPQV